MSAPITKLQYFHLKSQDALTSPEFKDIFTSAGGSGVHQLWQVISVSSSLVLISSSTENKELTDKLSKFVESKGHKEIELDAKTIPLDAPILSIEVFSVAKTDEELFEKKATEAQKHVHENTAAVASVGGWDKHEGGVTKVAGGLESVTWVSFTGWKDEEQHVESARDMAKGAERPRETIEKGSQNVFETVHLKKLF
jgi:hypothetical protein